MNLGSGSLYPMKTIVLAAFLTLLGMQSLCAANVQAVQQAMATYARLIPTLQPAVREWVGVEARKVSKDAKVSMESIKTDIQTRFAGQTLAAADIDTLALLVMAEATQNARNDMKASMENLKDISSRKAAQRQAAVNINKAAVDVQGAAQLNVRPAATNQPTRAATLTTAHGTQISANITPAKIDPVTEISDQEMLQLQRTMDQRSQLETLLSNMLKASSDTQSALISNLK